VENFRKIRVDGVSGRGKGNCPTGKKVPVTFGAGSGPVVAERLETCYRGVGFKKHQRQ
jgi:hypothetical protein